MTILGSNSALPANNRYPTSQLLKLGENHYLIDCGEGTQMQLRRYRVKLQKLKVIFISHMHGDHYFGLPGLLNTLQLLGRTAPLVLFGPSDLKDILEMQFTAGGGRLQYTLDFRSIDHVFKTTSKIIIYEDKKLQVAAFPLKHRIPCSAFIFKEKQGLRTYLPEVGEKYGVGLQNIRAIKLGANFTDQFGQVIPNDELTLPAAPSRSYAYCTDTLPLAFTAEMVRGASCLYHESTFMESEADRAKQTFHSTAKQAAKLALEARVGKLLIGHFSARYDKLDEMLEEAKGEFQSTFLAREGEQIEI